jgi:hypothetical protein
VYVNILHRLETQHCNTVIFCFMLLHRCPSTVGTGQYDLLQLDNSSSLSIDTISSASLSQSCKHRETVIYSVMAVLVATCAVLLVATVVLFRRVHLLRKRPRIKKRIIVNKNVTPLTDCSSLPQDQCEITIENCCNMNICETVST